MFVFIDFEASSLAKQSYPIEVGWVFEDGVSESHIIRPAPVWTDWDSEAERIHGIARSTLQSEGVPHEVVAARMIAALSGHDLLASAPSWDGKWLSALLRSAGHPRHTLRLRDTDEANREVATALLSRGLPTDALVAEVDAVIALAVAREQRVIPAHRALADACVERERWIAVRDAASNRARWLADPERA